MESVWGSQAATGASADRNPARRTSPPYLLPVIEGTQGKSSKRGGQQGRLENIQWLCTDGVHGSACRHMPSRALCQRYENCLAPVWHSFPATAGTGRFMLHAGLPSRPCGTPDTGRPPPPAGAEGRAGRAKRGRGARTAAGRRSVTAQGRETVGVETLSGPVQLENTWRSALLLAGLASWPRVASPARRGCRGQGLAIRAFLCESAVRERARIRNAGEKAGAQ